MLDRGDLPVLAGCAYLNAGTNGPLPRAAADAMAAEADVAATRPRIDRPAFEHLLGLRAHVRAALGRVLQAPPEEVALTSSTSHGIALVCAGLDWRAGHEVITTTEEHPGLLGPLDELSRRYGVVVRAVPGLEVAASVGPATRMVAVSHVLWTTGLILDLAAISAAAAAVGAEVLVDGAQAAGAIPLDVAATGVDYYSLPGQKWLLGPQGTGGLWVHSRRRETLRPATPSYFTYEGGKVGQLRPDASRFDAGSLDPAVLAGLAAAIEWVEGLPGGRPAWLDLGAVRAAEARRRLAGVEGVTVDDPGGPTSGLVALRLETADPGAAVEHLSAHDVLVRPIPGTPYVRISVGPWTSDADLDALTAGLASLAE